MINEQPLLPYIGIEVKNKSTGVWTEITAESTEITSVRGGTLGIAGVTTVDVGTVAVRIKNAYDPATTSTLQPQMEIRLYSKLASSNYNGAIFTGTLDDIETERVLNYLGEIDTYVNIYASDAVQAHVNKIVNGIYASNGTGHQTWDNRISDLSAYATTTINVAQTVVYSI